GMPIVNGRLSTHVLDTHAGRPAIGVAIELYEFTGEKAHYIQTAITNADGRTDRPLIGGRPLPIGRYELRFAVADHFRSRGIESGDPPFLDIVPLRFSIAAGGALSRPVALHALELFNLSRKLNESGGCHDLQR